MSHYVIFICRTVKARGKFILLLTYPRNILGLSVRSEWIPLQEISNLPRAGNNPARYRSASSDSKSPLSISMHSFETNILWGIEYLKLCSTIYYSCKPSQRMKDATLRYFHTRIFSNIRARANPAYYRDHSERIDRPVDPCQLPSIAVSFFSVCLLVYKFSR